MANEYPIDDAQRTEIDRVFQALHQLLQDSGRDLLVLTCTATPDDVRSGDDESLVLQIFRGMAAVEAIRHIESHSLRLN